MNTDLTVGKPWKALLFYILPLFGSAVFQQLYTLADTVIAGKFAQSTALTAIGASNSIVNILMAIALGANAGCAVLASRFFGSKENGKIKSTVSTALIAFAALSAALMIAGVLSCRAVLTAMQTPAEALDDSVTYLNIYYYGLPFLILYNLGTGIFSALGDSRTPFLFLVFSSVSNIVLDYFMVQPWGVAGVAWATFIAQGAACVLTLTFVLRRVSKLRTEESDKTRVFSGTLLKMLVLLAIPVALQNSFVSVGNLIIQVKINELANAQGIGITNGFTAGFKLLVFNTTCFCTCANGLTNFVSQNFGAHKFRRIKRGFYAALIISTLLTAAFAFSTFFFAEPLVLLFMPEGGNGYTRALFGRAVHPHRRILLFRRQCQGRGGRHGARLQRKRGIYGEHLHRPHPARRFRVYPHAPARLCGRRLGLGCRLDARYRRRTRLLLHNSLPAEKKLVSLRRGGQPARTVCDGNGG